MLKTKVEMRERRRELRNNATPEEKLLWEYLRKEKLGVKFRRQHSIGFYVVDFYCPKMKLVVELDGKYHEEENNVEYDKIRTEFFNKFGIKVIRFKNVDVNNNIEDVLAKIKQALLP